MRIPRLVALVKADVGNKRRNKEEARSRWNPELLNSNPCNNHVTWVRKTRDTCEWAARSPISSDEVKRQWSRTWTRWLLYGWDSMDDVITRSDQIEDMSWQSIWDRCEARTCKVRSQHLCTLWRHNKNWQASERSKRQSWILRPAIHRVGLEVAFRGLSDILP